MVHRFFDLNKTELDLLNRIVSMYLDYAELQATNREIMYMEDWVLKLNAFLQFNEKEILEGKGKISQEVANRLVIEEYEKYVPEQDKLYESDFDKLTKKLINKK
ncbi:MAG TPA: RhuM family protein [Candidatus Nanoarchaeia archaeon]|nr:RhuM family protein [Candidatus Nanoarchaeia archaeon]